MYVEAVIPHPLPSEATSIACGTMHPDTFAGFYERSARSLWAYLARVSADPALADDLLQEAYIRFLAADAPRPEDTDGEVAARRYLFRIATNLLRDHWRRPRLAPLADLPEELASASGFDGPCEARVLLGPALQQLRPRERQLLWLSYAEGYSHHEIAAITGLASASIRLLLFRARHKMQRLLTRSSSPSPKGASQ